MNEWTAGIIASLAFLWSVGSFILIFRVDRRVKSSQADVNTEQADLAGIETEIKRVEYLGKLKTMVEELGNRLLAVEAERDDCKKGMSALKSDAAKAFKELVDLLTLHKAEIIRLGGNPDTLNGRKLRAIEDKFK